MSGVRRLDRVMNLLVVGVGGQGVLRLSDIISTAALLEGYQVKKSEVHGLAQRGGSVNSHLRYGPVVLSPLVPKGEADVIIALEPLEGYRHLDYLKPDGYIVFDDNRIFPPDVYLGHMKYPNVEELMEKRLGERAIRVPATRIAVSEIGNLRTQNVVLLGAALPLLNLDPDNVRKAISLVFKGREKVIKLNYSALDVGLKFASALRS